MKKSNRIGYYIKEGVSSIFSHGFMSFASVAITVACLIVMGSFSLLALNVNSIVDDFENENVVVAFVDKAYSEDMGGDTLTDAIRAVEHVESVEYVSREQAFDSFVGKYEDNAMFDDLDPSILADRYAVYLDDVAYISQVQQQLKDINGIAKVNANLKVAKGFLTARNIVSAVSIALVVVLIIISLFIMSNTVKLTTVDRKDEIGIMKIVGATNAFIRWPFILQGFVLGLIGALVAFLLQWGIYELLTDVLLSNYSVSFITLVPFSAIAIPLLLIFIIIGLCVGIGGSSLAIKNYLKV
ncbi:MAG: permease-like cell division protein FtsX [Oscillospiraceae bacterium]|nr:permease-like cell division protein FtsX [Oscillospiraceae bacterium]